MAREYARIQVNIWADLDFRNVTTGAQHLYFLLLTNPTLNMAGVADWRPARLAKMASGWTVARVRKSAEELEQAGFVVTDDDSEEVLIRSFVRHDGVLKSPNLATAMVKDYAATGSPRIMAVIVAEVRRAVSEHPDWKGVGEAAVILQGSCPGTDPEPSSNPSGTLPEPFPNPSGTLPGEFGKTTPILQPATCNLQPATSNQQPAPPNTSASATATADTAPVADKPSFEDFWALYPRRKGKAEAEKSWGKATKTAKASDIISGLRAQLPGLAMQRRTDGDYRPYPATWLNQGRWADDPEGGHGGSKPSRLSIALWPKCPECRAPQEITHYDACTNQEWKPNVS